MMTPPPLRRRRVGTQAQDILDKGYMEQARCMASISSTGWNFEAGTGFRVYIEDKTIDKGRTTYKNSTPQSLKSRQ
jgi:hypothetical protein